VRHGEWEKLSKKGTDILRMGKYGDRREADKKRRGKAEREREKRQIEKRKS
jgi:hypothetical protein